MRTPNNDLYTNNTIDVQLTKKQAYRFKACVKRPNQTKRYK